VSRLVAALGALLAAGCVWLVPVAAAQSITHTCDTATTSDKCERWYTGGSVSLQWTWSQMGSLVSGCQNGNFTAEGRVERSCTVAWPGGTTIFEPVWIGIDRTPPQLVAVQPDRPPDYNGWFNHPVGVAFQGSDNTSGVASCSSTTYSGPDGAGVPIGGSCRDVAGNTGSGSLPLNYDATAPPAPVIEATPANGQVALRWSAVPLTEAEVVRLGAAAADAAVYRGPAAEFTDRSLRNERRYRYIVTLIDQAGNRAASTTSAVPTASKLLSPARRARVHGPPLLRWKRTRKASYYNVQLFRGGRKVLSRWPRVNRLQLRSSWRYAGRRRRLARGRYCWYVWPGHGKRSQRDYGRVLGKKCFRVVG
jgi:hypothetical protein